jgi:hypothetical protein
VVAAEPRGGRDVGFVFVLDETMTRRLDFSLNVACAWVRNRGAKRSYSSRMHSAQNRNREARDRNFVLCVHDCWIQGMSWPTRHTLWVRPCVPTVRQLHELQNAKQPPQILDYTLMNKTRLLPRRVDSRLHCAVPNTAYVAVFSLKKSRAVEVARAS